MLLTRLRLANHKVSARAKSTVALHVTPLARYAPLLLFVFLSRTLFTNSVWAFYCLDVNHTLLTVFLHLYVFNVQAGYTSVGGSPTVSCADGLLTGSGMTCKKGTNRDIKFVLV